MQNLKVGIVGFGRIAGVHADAWRAVSGVELVSVCDESFQSRERAAEQGLRGYDNLEAMIEREGLDAVSICTPPSVHAAQTIAAMQYGVNVLCEKPLTPNSSSTRNVLHAAQDAGVILQMATKFRHVPAIQFAKTLMEEGEIGDIETFHIEFVGAVDMINRWNSVRSIAGGGVIMDNGSHALDLLNYLFSDLKRVQSLDIQPIQKLEVEDQAMLLVETGAGVVGDVMLSWSQPSQGDTYLSIHGSKGDISIGWKGAYLQVGVALLTAERVAGSDELNDAVVAFLALALADVGRERDALALALTALARHLPRYNRSLARYAQALAD